MPEPLRLLSALRPARALNGPNKSSKRSNSSSAIAIPEHDLEMIVAQIGVSPDISSAYTPNAGPMDAIVKVQLKEHRQKSAQQYVSILRHGFAADDRFSQLEFSFDAGGMVRSALNEGKSSPLNIRITGKDQKLSYQIAEALKADVKKVAGVVDARILQRMNYPQFTINVDRRKAADLGLTQQDVMKNVVAACNSSIAFNKRNFWIDPVSRNQYFVGVQYPEEDIESIDTLLDIPITGDQQDATVPLALRGHDLADHGPLRDYACQHSVHDRADVECRRAQPGARQRRRGEADRQAWKTHHQGDWATFDPRVKDEQKTIPGSKIAMAGEYSRMQDTFKNLGFGLILASLLIYFLMVALDRSFIVPLTVMFVVPISLGGVLPLLYLTGTALNVQSLLGIIFVVGIKVANTVLMTDLAQELRRHEGLSPTEAIRKAAALRVRPITMTALAAFFAMVPAALALERGSEANAPLARAILGGLIAGEPATLFLLPALIRSWCGIKSRPVASSIGSGARLIAVRPTLAKVCYQRCACSTNQ